MNRLSSLFYILGFIAYVFSSVVFPITYFGGNETEYLVAALAFGAAGIFVAIGALTSRPTKARRIAGAALGFSLLVVPLLATLQIQIIFSYIFPVWNFVLGVPLFLAWGISRPFRGAGYFAILIGAISLFLGGVTTVWLLYVLPLFVVLQCVPPIVAVVSARALEGVRTITVHSTDSAINGTSPVARTGRNNVFAVLSVIFSLLGGGVVGIVLGHLARGQIRSTGEHGAGTALTGMILGYVQVAAIIAVGILFLVLGLASRS